MVQVVVFATGFHLAFATPKGRFYIQATFAVDLFFSFTTGTTDAAT